MYGNVLYPTALHLFEARKFLDHRPDLAEQIRLCKHVEMVIRVSGQLANQTRPDWANIGLSMVRVLLPVRRYSIDCWSVVTGCLDGRGIVPQVPPAPRPARDASQHVSQRARLC